jgi:bifunctional non-homologous end joining protein LigD
LTVQLIAFDVVFAEGVDLRIRPWSDRRETLERLLAGADGALRIAPVIASDQALHDALIADGWEGTVAKRGEARDVCGRRSRAWVKIKSPAARDRDRRRVTGV